MFKKLFTTLLALFTLSMLATSSYANIMGKKKNGTVSSKHEKKIEKVSEKISDDLEDVSEEIAELQSLVNEKSPKMSQADQRKFQNEISSFKQKENDLRDNLTSMKSQNGTDVKKLKSDMQASVDDLEDRIKESKKNLRKIY